MKPYKIIKNLTLLSVCTIISLITARPLSADNGSGSFDNNVKWTYNNQDNKLTIIGSGDIETDSIPWSDVMSDIKSVDIASGITSLPDKAFYNADKLTSIVIPGTVKVVPQYAFSGCSNLSSIVIEEGVEKLSGNCFEGTAIKSITIPSTLTTIESSFYQCKSLEYLIIPDTVTSIGNDMCFSCDNLRYLEFYGSCNIKKSAFGGCENLKAVIIGEKVSGIDYFAFWNCKNLVSVNIPDTITNINQAAFYGSSKELTIYGVKDSTANEYADKYDNISFVDISTDAGKTKWDIAWIKAKLQAPSPSPDNSNTIPVYDKNKELITYAPVPTKVPTSIATVKGLSIKSKISGKTKTYTISWKKVNDASGYEIKFRAKKYGKYKKIYVKAPKNKKTYKIKSTKKMYFKVRAYMTTDTETIYGKYSKTIRK